MALSPPRKRQETFRIQLLSRLCLSLLFILCRGQDEESTNDNNSTNQTDGIADDTVFVCYGYMYNDSSFERDAQARPIPCDPSENNTFGNQWGPSEHQSLACCTGDARYYVQTSQMGGFDVVFGTRFPDPTCHAYTAAMQATLCDPRQGDYVGPFVDQTPSPTSAPTFRPPPIPQEIQSNLSFSFQNNASTTMPSAVPSFAPSTLFPTSMPSVVPDPILYICRNSCNAWFQACGMPGVNFPPFAEYENGTSLCQAAWGGFQNDGPCQSRPLGFPCQVNLQLEISDNDCLELVEPTQDVIDSYAKYRAPPVPSECQDNPNSVTVVEGVTIVLIIIGSVCCLLCAGLVSFIYCRRRQMDLADAGEMW